MRTNQQTLTLMLMVADTPEAKIASKVLNSFYSAAGQQLLSAGLLAVVGEEGVTTSMSDHDDVPIPLCMSPDGSSFGYFCPSTGWVVPERSERVIYGLQFGPLKARLLSKLECLHVMPPIELIPHTLWEIDGARIPGRAKPVPVWIARRLADPRTWHALLELVRLRPAPGMRLILSLTPEDRIPKSFVRGHEVVALQSVVDFGDGLRVDPNILAARLAHGLIDEAPITMTADGGSITVRGKTYTFTGAKHRAIIRHLYEAWQRGEPRCLTAEVLVAANSGDQVRKLSQAFKGRIDWHDFICEEAGQCWIVA